MQLFYGLVERTCFAVILLLFVVFRFVNLGAECLWFDEIFSVHAALKPPTELLGFIAADVVHPPLFYLLLKVWIQLGGDSLIALRLFPIVVAVPGLFLVRFIARELGLSPLAVLVAVGLTAVNGALIAYAREVRMYSLFWTLSLLSIWLFLRYVRREQGFAFLFLANLLLIYTHYFGWFVIGSQVLIVVLQKRELLRRMIAMTAVLLVSFAPWLAAIRASRTVTPSGLAENIGWNPVPDVVALFQFVLAIAEPFHFARSSIEPASILFFSVPLVLIAFVAFTAFAVDADSGDDELSFRLIFAGKLVTFPIFAAVLISWFSPYSIWGTRHLTIIFVPAFLLFATAIDAIRWRPLASGLIVIAAVTIVLGGVSDFRRPRVDYVWCQWRSLLGPAVSPDVPVYTVEHSTAYSAWWNERKYNSRVAIIAGFDGRLDGGQFFLPRGFNDVKTVTVDEVVEEEILIAYRESELVQTPSVRAYLSTHGYEVVSEQARKALDGTAFLVRMKKTNQKPATRITDDDHDDHGHDHDH